MKRFSCLLDMDGVLTNFVEAFCNLHGVSNREWKIPGSYDLILNLGLPQDIWKGVDYNFWRKMVPMCDSYSIVHAVTSRFNLDEIGILTVDPEQYGYPRDKVGDMFLGKLDWIQEHFPALRRNFYMGVNKDFFVHENLILIDDHDKNIDAFEAKRGKGILLPRIWNRNYKEKTIHYLVEKLDDFIGDQLATV